MDKPYPALNLPAAALSVRVLKGKREVFDPVRRQFVLLTPEEWVRQHILHFLIYQKNYPQSRMAVEYSLEVNRLVKRCDILVFDKSLQALLIVEVKAAGVNLSQQVLEQALRYNSVFQAPYLLLSNGIRHYMLSIPSDGEAKILDEIPDYPDLEKISQE